MNRDKFIDDEDEDDDEYKDGQFDEEELLEMMEQQE